MSCCLQRPLLSDRHGKEASSNLPSAGGQSIGHASELVLEVLAEVYLNIAMTISMTIEDSQACSKQENHTLFGREWQPI